MKPNFQVFRKFMDPEMAQPLLAALNESDIDYELVSYDGSNTLAFQRNEVNRQTEVFLHRDDFTKAYEIEEVLGRQEAELLNSDYYVYDFDNEELKEIVAAREEWTPADYILAQRLLAERNVALSEEEITMLQVNHIGKVAEPIEASDGFIFAIYAMALLGGFGGILLGWYVAYWEVSLPNGISVHAYTRRSRNRAKTAMQLGIFMQIVYGFLYIYSL